MGLIFKGRLLALHTNIKLRFIFDAYYRTNALLYSITVSITNINSYIVHSVPEPSQVE